MKQRLINILNIFKIKNKNLMKEKGENIMHVEIFFCM